MDGHGQQQQDTAEDANNETEKEEKEEDIKSAEDKASSQGPSDDRRQPNDPSARGGKQNESELITGQKDTPCPAESGHKVKNGDRRDGGGNPTPLPPAKPDRLFRTEPQKDLNKRNEDNKTESTNNRAAGPTEGQTPHQDGPAVGGTNNTSDQTGGPTGTSDDTPAERRRQEEQKEEGGKSLMEGDGQQQLVGQEASNDTVETVENKTQTEENKAAAQGPTDDKTQHNDPSVGGGKQNDSELITGQKDTPFPAESGHRGKNGDKREGGEKTTPLSSVKPDLLHNTEEQIKSDQPQSDIESDVATKEKETDKAGHLHQTEGETQEKQCGEEQPEKQEMGDGEEGTSSTHRKREHHLETVSTGKRENETPSETEETGREPKSDQDSKKQRVTEKRQKSKPHRSGRRK
ncbi:dentin matrix acidic phosphoprotein 1-like isoform X2 [Etheostoma spectabile]|uniref:dentin matrix acidic phosphoprotein 1-like isoform X2 n=1 Tax=Etheostoma spectabile TaxID=54343 RepID=UPI0013AED32C|nr:dentin matrix acidic phosphoprotein 1-like isoform X2 [Etheostoma spectabile]